MIDQKILVPLDSSAISRRSIEKLIALKNWIKLPPTLLHVLDLEALVGQGFPEMSRAAFEQRASGQATQFLIEQQQIFSAAGIETRTLLKQGNTRDLICKLANSGEFDLLAIGRNPVSEIRDLLFGQVCNYVVHRVKCPVLLL